MTRRENRRVSEDAAEEESIYERFLRANARHLDDPMVAAFEVAMRLGQWVVGPEHVFATLLAGKPDAETAEVMSTLGVDAAMFEERLRRTDDRPSDRALEEFFRERARMVSQGRSIHSSPAYSRIDGLVRGFSASRHDGPARSIDYLLAFLWSGPYSLWPYELDSLGVPAEKVRDELVVRGVALPIGALPATVKGIQIFKFSSDHLASLLTELNRRYPEDSDPAWRIEVRRDHAVAFADPRIDLRGAFTEVGVDWTEDAD
jgi:hypothetical protein